MKKKEDYREIKQLQQTIKDLNDVKAQINQQSEEIQKRINEDVSRDASTEEMPQELKN